MIGFITLPSQRCENTNINIYHRFSLIRTSRDNQKCFFFLSDSECVSVFVLTRVTEFPFHIEMIQSQKNGDYPCYPNYR